MRATDWQHGTARTPRAARPPRRGDGTTSEDNATDRLYEVTIRGHFEIALDRRVRVRAANRDAAAERAAGFADDIGDAKLLPDGTTGQWQQEDGGEPEFNDLGIAAHYLLDVSPYEVEPTPERQEAIRARAIKLAEDGEIAHGALVDLMESFDAQRDAGSGGDG